MMLKNIFLYSSIFLICAISLVLITSNLAFLMGLNVNVLNVIISIVISIFIINDTVRKSGQLLIYILVAAAVCTISYFLATFYYDISYDGQGYHQETIYLLKNGWNPIYEDSHSFRSWINHYQKGNEIIQSNIYLLTDKIEAVKMINILFIYIAFITCLSFLSALNIKHIYQWLIAFVIVFNPVVFTQVFTNYIDANWYLTLVISLSSLLCYFRERKTMYIIVFVASSVIFCSLKLTSIPVFTVFAVFTFSYHLFFHKKKMIMPFVTIFLLSVICNVHPFLTNVQKGYHILHPFAGSKKTDILNQNIPEVLLNKNRAERILISLFSETSNGTKSEEYEGLKIPFEINKANLYLTYDTRLGGFGFLFSGIMVLSIILLVYLLFMKGENSNKKILMIILACLLVTVLINPASWWARLSAQIWLLPITIIIFGLLSKKKVPKFLSQISLSIFALNILIPLYLTFNELQNNKKIMNQFVNSVSKKTIVLDLSNSSGFQQYYLKFKERNIKYRLKEVKDKSHLAPFTPDVYYEIE